MEVTRGAEAVFASLSREVEMLCDAAGVIVWADQRAQSTLRAEKGMPLASLVAPGSEEKVQQFLERSFSLQIDSPIQRRVKGTGLGLSLCAKVADLLGGRMSVESTLGQGSTFCLQIPRVHPEAKEMADMAERSQTLDPSKAPILVVEDDRQTLFLYEKYLEGSGFQVIPARSIEEARRALDRVLPSAVVLDIMLEGETSWAFLADLKSNEKTRDIPALVVTVTNREQKARALGADEFYVKPLDQSWLLKRLKALARMGPIEKVPVIVHTSKSLAEEERKRLATETSAILSKQSLSREVALARIRDALVKAGIGSKG